MNHYREVAMKRCIAIALLVCFVCACQSTNNLSEAQKRFGSGDLKGALKIYNNLVESSSTTTSDLMICLNDRALIQYLMVKENHDVSLAEKAVEDWTRYFELAATVPNASVNLVRAYFGCGLIGLQRKEEALVQFDKVCADAPDGQFACQWAKAAREGTEDSVCKFDDIRKKSPLYGGDK